eukprot:3885658-Ditylum_brightwellii.AAC.1
MEEEGELTVTCVNGAKGHPPFLFQVGSLLVCKCQEVNTPACYLIGKPVTLIAGERELLVHGCDGSIGMAHVKRTDNLSDVRSYIDEYFDDGAMPSNYLFQ